MSAGFQMEVIAGDDYAIVDGELSRTVIEVGKAGGSTSQDLIKELMSTTPFFIGHRGSGDYWPEHTMDAYAGAVAAGAKAIEVSVWELPDGTWVCAHDSTMDRMVLGRTGSIKRLSGPSATKQYISDPGVLGPGWEGGSPMTLLSDVLLRFGGKVAIFLENKQGFTDRTIRMLDFVESYVSDAQLSVVYKTIGYNNAKTTISDGMKAARDRGYRIWAYMDAGVSQAIIDMVSAASDFLGIPIPDPAVTGLTPMTDAEVANVVKKGKPVIGWEVHRRYQVTKYVALGVRGMMCSGIPYVKPGAVALQTEDQFDLLVRAPGELPRSYINEYAQGYAINAGDGEMVIKNRYGQGILMGGMGPIPAACSIEFEMKFDVLPADSSHAGVAFCKPDDQAYFPASASNMTPGYHVVIRPTGVCGIYTHAPGSSAGTQLGGALNTSAIPADTWTKFRITLTSTTISLQRLDGTPSTVLSVTNTSYRGGYFHLTRNYDTTTGQFVRFRNVKIV